MDAHSIQGPVSLYLHVPFCAQKCHYCAFYSAAADGDLINRYVAALVRELELRSAESSAPPETVFFGGGTPSLLNIRQWETILDAFHRLGLAGATEWTIEANPATISADKARLLRSAGVNRVSMGVQSLDENLLDRLGRVHSRAMVFKSFETLRNAGFDNLNLDLMFAIPGQTLDVWRETLREAIALGSEHLSSYEVIYEEDTPLYDQLKAGEFAVDEDLAAAMFEELIQAAGRSGLVQYEIANFARSHRTPAATRGSGFSDVSIPSLACRHNINYWRGGAYRAFGPSASGFESGRRYRNVSNTVRYCERLEKGELPVEWTDALPPLARAGEIAAFGLRMNSGWPFEAFHSATGFDLRLDWAPEMDALVRQGWGLRESDRFRLTSHGLRFADAAGSEFLRTSPPPPTRRKSAPIGAAVLVMSPDRLKVGLRTPRIEAERGLESRL